MEEQLLTRCEVAWNLEYILILQKDAAPGAKNYLCVVADWVRKNKSMLELFSPALAILVLVMNKKLHISV